MNMSENNSKDLKIQSNLNLYNFIKGMIYEGIYGKPMPENMNVKYEDYIANKEGVNNA